MKTGNMIPMSHASSMKLMMLLFKGIGHGWGWFSVRSQSSVLFQVFVFTEYMNSGNGIHSGQTLTTWGGRLSVTPSMYVFTLFHSIWSIDPKIRQASNRRACLFFKPHLSDADSPRRQDPHFLFATLGEIAHSFPAFFPVPSRG